MECKCNIGYFNDRLSSECQPCKNSVCGTCISNSTDCDVFCKPGCITCDLTGECIGTVCKDKYFYNSNTSSCENCNAICGTCSDSADNCISCLNPLMGSSDCD